MSKNITFLGAGSMAEAIISGLLKTQTVSPLNITATNLENTERLESLKKRYQIKTTHSRIEAIKEADVIIFAMKPYGIKECIKEIKPYCNKEALFISILAGIPTSYIEDLLEFNAAVIRTMPNTSASIGLSATSMSKGAYANHKQMEYAKELFEAIGSVLFIEEEKQNAATGIAGSGPAYFYYFIEAMYIAAEEANLTKNEADSLIKQMIIGVGKKLESTNKSPQELYQEIMSPKGTTEAGFKILEEEQLQQHFIKAIKRAIQRSVELGSVYSHKIE
ncbi:pyrroline-5-carboxylate reductase [Alkalihalobacillus trypoxylicola]|nr:pyrroline-5-carboxylate reductase [Alkalihalobacillus trypoxylicola]